ncbi:hypothetical protein [Serratia symbiotica]|uniref:hypothetical protein n=1 Tax=Serratia symbiotica TaxID=138074 RepID=UPI0004AC00EE|nr:hypothetical protein [Serratia symbiotica]CDS58841.1 hypothetical protein SYMBAF_90079 [Serratia symbiotica]
MTNWRQRSVIAIVVEEGNVKIPGIWYAFSSMKQRSRVNSELSESQSELADSL